MSCASTSSHEARVLNPARLTSEGGSGIEAALVTSCKDVDLTDYFSAEVVRKMPAIERTMYANKVRNYRMLEDLGEFEFSILGCSFIKSCASRFCGQSCEPPTLD